MDMIQALEGLRYKVWLEDIASPSCPEYEEHHESIQKILGEIDKMIIALVEQEASE